VGGASLLRWQSWLRRLFYLARTLDLSGKVRALSRRIGRHAENVEGV